MNITTQTRKPKLDLSFPAPSTVEEYEKLGGKGSCLADANAAHTQSTVAKWAEKMCDAIETQYGIKRKIDKVATDKAKERAANPANVTPVKERASSYLERAEAKIEDKAAFAALANELAASTPVDPTPQRAAVRIPAEYVRKAESIMAYDADQKAAAVAKLQAAAPSYVLEDSVDSLAGLIHEFVKASLAI